MTLAVLFNTCRRLRNFVTLGLFLLSLRLGIPASAFAQGDSPNATLSAETTTSHCKDQVCRNQPRNHSEIHDADEPARRSLRREDQRVHHRKILHD